MSNRPGIYIIDIYSCKDYIIKRSLILVCASLSVLFLLACCDPFGSNSPKDAGTVTYDYDAETLIVAVEKPADGIISDYTKYIGKQYIVTIPAGLQESAIWGTDVYSSDSSIATAAVHSGLITFASGGKVTIEILAGRSSYAESTRYAVTSLSWEDWRLSYRFVK